MDKRQLSEKTKNKILKVAADILFMHGDLVGDSVCQDWSGTEEDSPVNNFSRQELDDIAFNYEIHNSKGDDYDPEYHGLHDEMMASFSLAVALKDMITKK